MRGYRDKFEKSVKKRSHPGECYTAYRLIRAQGYNKQMADLLSGEGRPKEDWPMFRAVI